MMGLSWEETLVAAEQKIRAIAERLDTADLKLLDDLELDWINQHCLKTGWYFSNPPRSQVTGLLNSIARLLMDHAYAMKRKFGTRWSRDLPTEPGWYWYAPVGQKVPHLCEITAHPADGRLIVDWGWDGWNLSNVEYGGVWAKAELPETPK